MYDQNKIGIEGYIDSQKIQEDFTFNSMDKDDFVNRLRAASDSGKVFTVVDINGKVFSINYAKACFVMLNVIDYVNVEAAKKDW